MELSAARAVLAALTLALLGACAAQPAPEAAAHTASTDLVWPRPPSTPRIRFVGSLEGPRDIGADRSGGLLAFLKGEPEIRVAQPFGLAVDAERRLYVVDSEQRRVLVFDQARRRFLAFPEAGNTLLERPIDIAVSNDGRAFVSDSEAGLIHVFTLPQGKHLRSFGKDQLERPTGLAIDVRRGVLLVLDTVNGRLASYDLRTLSLRRVIGEPGSGARAFHSPTAVSVAADGHVYVTDALNFRIQVLGPNLDFERSFGTVGDGPGRFSRPKGVACDSEGNVYVVDALFDNVQIFDPEGRLLLAFGSPGSGPGEFWLPSGIAIDGEDRIYVSDTYNRRVQVFERVKASGDPPLADAPEQESM